MNRGNPGSILIIVMLMLGGLYAVASVVLTSGNSIGEMCQFLVVGGFFLAFLSPRVGFFTWLVFCGYNDLLKRLLVAGGRITHEDLKFVLGITPAMFAGVVTSLLLSGLMRTRNFTSREWTLFATGVFLMLAAAALAARQDGGMNGVLQSVANNGLYSLLLFVVPVLFQNKASLVFIWKCLVISFLPVAVYGVIQQFQGFADFEVEYLLTGLSIEIKQLYSGEVRPFSTLNSPTALSVVCAALAVTSLILGFTGRSTGSRPMMSRVLAVFCCVTYLAGLIASTGRSPILILPAALIGGWCFATPARTKVFYSIVISLFLLLVSSSGWLIDHLEDLNERATSLGAPGAFVSRMMVVGTYWDRLSGFSTVLMNPKAWTLFGYGKAEDGTGMYYYHDPISEILVRYGAIALVVVLIVMVLMLRWFHRQSWRLNDPVDRRFAASLIALGFSILLVSTVSGSVMAVFPVNIFFWLTCSAVLGLAKKAATKAEPIVAQSPRVPHYHPQHINIHQTTP